MVPVAGHKPELHAPAGRQLLTDHLAGLEHLITRANMPGHLDGLLAHHILAGQPVSFTWNIDPMTPAWFADNAHRLDHANGPAVLGYGLASFPSAMSATAREHLLTGLPKLMRRNPVQPDGVTFVNDPDQVVGIALAVNAVRDDLSTAHAWIAGVLQDPKLRPATLLLHIFQEHARHLVRTACTPLSDPRSTEDPADLAGLQWLATMAPHAGSRDTRDIRDLYSRILSAIMTGRVGQVSAPRAALLLRAVTHIITTSIDEIVLGPSHVGIILDRFEDAMRRWRFDADDLAQAIRWPITSEREVQDILWVILRPVFDDLVDEETLRKVGHSSYRADFGIPSLGLLIEVKYARKASDFKLFEKEIMEDYLAYLKENGPYQRMAVFIYDESASVQEHGTTRNAILAFDNITDVIIVSRPSHLPLPERIRSRAGRRARTRTARS